MQPIQISIDKDELEILLRVLSEEEEELREWITERKTEGKDFSFHVSDWKNVSELRIKFLKVWSDKNLEDKNDRVQ